MVIAAYILSEFNILPRKSQQGIITACNNASYLV